MKPTKHTPGPWTVTPGQNTIWASDGDLKVATVADLPWIESPATGRISSNWQGEAANARLIAAAPELLAALQACGEALTAALSALNAEDESGEGYPVTRAQINGAQAMRHSAIAKAQA